MTPQELTRKRVRRIGTVVCCLLGFFLALVDQVHVSQAEAEEAYIDAEEKKIAVTEQAEIEAAQARLILVNVKLSDAEKVMEEQGEAELRRLQNVQLTLLQRIHGSIETPETPMTEFMQRFCHPQIAEKEQFIREISTLNNITPELVVSIMFADSGCGRSEKGGSDNNPGNVGHCDNCGPVSFENIEDGIRAIVDTLNNKYLWKLNTIGELSCGGRARSAAPDCEGTRYPFYASSQKHWNKNVLSAMNRMLDNVDESFNFRTN